jgi:hypothetical protein
VAFDDVGGYVKGAIIEPPVCTEEGFKKFMETVYPDLASKKRNGKPITGRPSNAHAGKTARDQSPIFCPRASKLSQTRFLVASKSRRMKRTRRMSPILQPLRKMRLSCVSVSQTTSFDWLSRKA